ncbi:VOC family protein [uncultured Litoreibacter sp.]|uniref:VOC family protein n=1 Tax=uncultured Litoreibacter sp. TaxID=1392394 RepID=UPI0026196A79|nr:VOC family protein [uncultured Litoreibacter sp.]
MQTIKPELVFDHIAVLAKSVGEGVDYIRDTLGVDVPPGGSHPRMGTHNHLLSLGPDCFLEIIAIDPDADAPTHPRWFGLDSFTGEPCVGAWVLGSRDIHGSLIGMQATSGPVIEMKRGELVWQMSVREDGALPLSGAFPLVLQWPKGPHVARRMSRQDCSFVSLTIASPETEFITTWLGDRLDDPRIKLISGETRLTAVIDTPSGQKVLS